MKIAGANIIITGAAGGIGEAFSRELYKRGANLILAGRNLIKLNSLREQLLREHPDASNRIFALQVDITNRHSLEKFTVNLEKLPLNANILINNAGTNQFALFDSLNRDEIHNILQTNSIAPMQVIHLLLPSLLQQHESLIINVGSTFGSIGFPGYSAYCASKYALRGFSEALGRELAGSSVTLKYLSPRATRTRFNSDNSDAMNKALSNTVDKPEYVARCLISLMEGNKKELVIGWPEKLFVKLNQLFPSLVTSSIARQLPVIRRYATLPVAMGKT